MYSVKPQKGLSRQTRVFTIVNRDKVGEMYHYIKPGGRPKAAQRQETPGQQKYGTETTRREKLPTLTPGYV